MFRDLTESTKDKMNKAIAHYKNELKTIRTGRASTSMFDSVKVEAYGNFSPLNTIGTLQVSDAHTVTLQLWDMSLITAAEKAIMNSGLGLNPTNDGRIIRIPIPQLTEERRKDYVKLAKKMAEEAKVVVRNERRDILKKVEKDKTASEDDIKKFQDDIQKLTDMFIKEIDAALVAKEKELLAI